MSRTRPNAAKLCIFTDMRLLLTHTCLALCIPGLLLTGCSGSGTGRVFTPAGARLIWRPLASDPRPANVFVSGTFNGWHMSNPAFKCSWNALEGGFSITLTLPPGRYEYKFVVDGRWVHDPDARETAPDPLGGKLGVFYVKPATAP